MLTPPLRTFLHNVISSATSLHLLLLFEARPRFEAPARLVSDLLCRDIWSVERALEELVEHHVLQVSRRIAGEALYRFAPSAEHRMQLDQLIHAYNDPLLRHEIQQQIRDREHYQPAGLAYETPLRTSRFGEHGLLLTDL